MNIKVILELDDSTKIELNGNQLRQLFDFLQRLFLNEHNYKNVHPTYPWTATYIDDNNDYTYEFKPTKVPPPLPPKNK